MRVLHVNDIASIGTHLVREARSRGLDWDLLPIARVDPAWSPRMRPVRRALRGAAWELRLCAKALPSDLIHVHGATVDAHTWWVPRPMALHLHGSDARIARYDLARRSCVERAITRAGLVFYTTPDLAEHVLDLRPDALLHPVVVDAAAAPRVRELPETGPIVFPSRWDDSKGGDRLFEVLRAVRSAAPEARIEGVDWGDRAGEAAKLGVRLVPRMSHDGYLSWLSTGRLAVGQATGVMGASELEAMTIGIPLVMPLLARWYSGDHPSLRDVPVVAERVDRLDDIPAAVREAVGEGMGLRAPTEAASWVAAHHGPSQAVDSLLASYGRWEAGR
ncbi:hypothetical protein [Schaalia hyovaginalis]|uniref:Uncharacterized protein n=1 Tax=Schaalia hyovaginalis TaxID=29316 RepID=A0A923E1J9_9ACTO|nr:hypothetical protein [Schaalia hyovaginalis]MBB6334258.1 hypothetical protein [Schaalia hyovaginalis]MDY2668875.1 hypothetical protein [Schaalia hyovaginalis]